MRKIFALALCFSMLACLFSCEKNEKSIGFTTDNAFEFVSYTLAFDGITVRENTNATMSGKYYITCTATLRVAPRAEYSFDDAYLWFGFDFDGGWNAIHVGNNTAGTSLIYDWDDVVRLDKDGYAERTIELFCYANSYDKLHPSNAKYDCKLCTAGGSVRGN